MDHWARITNSKDRASKLLDEQLNYVETVSIPSLDGIPDGDELVSLFKSDIINMYATAYIYESYLLKIQELLQPELKLLPNGCMPSGVKDLSTLEDAINMLRSLASKHTNRHGR